VPVDVRSHTVIFEDIEFPSKDGFTIEPRVQVRYKVVPEKAPELFVMLCENGILYQKDDTVEDQAKNPILQKIILPLIRGYVRIEGSKHDAREYISKPKEDAVAGQKATNPRERLQEELMAKVRPECEKLGVVIDYIAVGQPRMNTLLEELAFQIREREQSRILRKTNEQKVEQFKQETELKSTQALEQRNKMVIDADTKLEQAKILAERRIQNEKAKIEAELSAAQERLEGSKKKAESILTTGKADANIATAENEATVAEIRKAIEGFESPDHFAQYHVLLKLSPVLSEVFASDTSDFAKLFSTYLAAPAPGKTAATAEKSNAPKSAEPDRK
jgi:SPFH domain / Band 7 family